MKIKYIADDGTEFSSAVECQNYENHRVKMFDAYFKPTDIFTQAEYFLVLNSEQREWFIERDKECNGDYDIDYPENYGIWIFDMNTEKFITIRDMIKRYNNIEDIIYEAAR